MKIYAGRLTKDNSFAIYVYDKVDGQKIRVKTKLRATPDQFNPKTGKCYDQKLKFILDGYCLTLSDQIIEAERRGDLLTYLEMKQIIKNIVSDQAVGNDLCITNLYNDYMKTTDLATTDLATATKQCYKTAGRIWGEYVLETKTSDNIVRFKHHDFDHWIKWCKEKGYADNSIANFCRCIRKVLNLAYKEKLIDTPIADIWKFHPKNKLRTECVMLTTTELEELEKVDNLMVFTQKKLLVFLFLCYTGLRHSDYFQLFDSEKSEITDTHIIIYRSKKTGKRIYLPNAGYLRGAWRILDRCGGTLPCYKSVYSFTRQLKPMWKRLGRPENECKIISCHMSRKIFATNLLTESNLPLVVVQKLLSHSSINTTLAFYERSNDQRIYNALINSEV